MLYSDVSPPLVVLSVDPGPHGQLVYEHLTCLAEQDGRLGGDHLHVLVELHDLLNPGQG